MRAADGAWVGWAGTPGDAAEPFDTDGMHLVSVGLSSDEVGTTTRASATPRCGRCTTT